MQSSEMPGPEFHDFSYVGKFFSNFGRQILEKDDMKLKSLIHIGLSVSCLALVFAPDNSSHASPSTPADLLYYDAVRDFSAEANPNGVWTYGWSGGLTGSFVLYTRSSMPEFDDLRLGWDDPANSNFFTPSVAINLGGDRNDGNITFSAGALLLHPGGINGRAYSHVIWTSPTNGTYFVTSNFISQQYAIAVDVNILVQGTSVFTSVIHDIDQYRPFTGVFRLRAGEQIDFAVGPNGNFRLHPGNTGFQATILPVGR